MKKLPSVVLFASASIISCLLLSCVSEPSGPTCATCPSCPEPRVMMAGIRVAGEAFRVVDASDDGSHLIVHREYSTVLSIVRTSDNGKVAEVEVSHLLQQDESLLWVVGYGFLGRGSDSVLVSAYLTRPRGDTASRVWVVNIVTDSVSQIRPSRCLENGWDPIANTWFYARSVERLANKILLVSTSLIRYDYKEDTFLSEEIRDPQGNPNLFYMRTRASGLLVGVSVSYKALGEYPSTIVRSVLLVVDETMADISSKVSDARVYCSIRGTDYVLVDVMPRIYASASGEGWGPELWVVDASVVKREGKIDNAIVAKRNLHEAYCSLATLGIVPHAYDAEHIYVSMHRDGEAVQLPYRISLTDPSVKSLVTYH